MKILFAMKKEFEIDITKNKNVASSGDCTGLIPSMPQTQEEKDAYSEIVKLPSGVKKK
jgi:hypothetical protein